MKNNKKVIFFVIAIIFFIISLKLLNFPVADEYYDIKDRYSKIYNALGDDEVIKSQLEDKKAAEIYDLNKINHMFHHYFHR